MEHKDSPFWKLAIELVEKDEYEKKNKKKFNPEAFIDLDNVRSIKSIHNRSKTNSFKVKFGPEPDTDELSAGSNSTIETLDDTTATQRRRAKTRRMSRPPLLLYPQIRGVLTDRIQR